MSLESICLSWVESFGGVFQSGFVPSDFFKSLLFARCFAHHDIMETEGGGGRESFTLPKISSEQLDGCPPAPTAMPPVPEAAETAAQFFGAIQGDLKMLSAPVVRQP